MAKIRLQSTFSLFHRFPKHLFDLIVFKFRFAKRGWDIKQKKPLIFSSCPQAIYDGGPLNDLIKWLKEGKSKCQEWKRKWKTVISKKRRSSAERTQLINLFSSSKYIDFWTELFPEDFFISFILFHNSSQKIVLVGKKVLW